MFFLKALDEDALKKCNVTFKDKDYDNGNLTQPLSKHYKVKQNEQTSAVPEDTKKYLVNLLYNNAFIDSVYCPNRVSVNFYNKYEEGDYYDTHVDSFKATPKSNNVFFDYGFSISLTSNYEGGEFLLHTDVGPISHKLLAGEIAVFPIIYPHGVQKVTSGTRRNIIGWFSSNVTYEQSFILKNLYEVNIGLMQKDQELFVKSTLVQMYLKKLWGK